MKSCSSVCISMVGGKWKQTNEICILHVLVSFAIHYARNGSMGALVKSLTSSSNLFIKVVLREAQNSYKKIIPGDVRFPVQKNKALSKICLEEKHQFRRQDII